MAKRASTDLIAQYVHTKLKRRIMSLELRQGSRLVEDEISSSLDVGRTPVREALLRLQGEGLVSREKGWIVQGAKSEDMMAIFESRIAVESYATRLASLRVDEDDLAQLERLVATMDEEQPRGQLNRRDREFHETIVKFSGNAMLVDMHQLTQFRYWNLRLPVIFGQEQTLRSNRQHRDILDALRARDPDAAEANARIHIETTLSIVREAFEDV